MHPHLIALAAHHQNGLMGGLTGWVVVSLAAVLVVHVLKSLFRRSTTA
jgi:hypothetical protein